MEVVVTGRREGPPRDVLPGEDRVDARHGERLALADGRDACVRVRRAEDLEVKHPVHLDVHRVTGVAGDDRLGQRVGEAGAAGVAGPVLLDGSDAADRILDRVIAGAATEVSLEVEGQVLFASSERLADGHDHAGGAEAALERLGVEKRLLHRMEFAVAGQPLERGDLGPRPGRRERGNCGPACRRARPCRPRSRRRRSPFSRRTSRGPQEGSQALAGARFGGEGFAVDRRLFIALTLRANLFGEVMRQVLAVGRRPVHVVEVQADGIVDQRGSSSPGRAPRSEAEPAGRWRR